MFDNIVYNYNWGHMISLSNLLRMFEDFISLINLYMASAECVYCFKLLI